MAKYLRITPPKRGSKITVAKSGLLQVPDDPVIPFIQHQGLPEEVFRPVRDVLNLAVQRCYASAKRLEWFELYAGQKAEALYGEDQALPEDTLKAIQEFKVCLKGPLGPSPLDAEGHTESLDARLHAYLDLFACVQPVRYLHGAPSPLKRPNAVNLVLFREHTEDLSPNLEWKKGSPIAKRVIQSLNEDAQEAFEIRGDSGIGLKTISVTATKRLIRLALDYAIKQKRSSVTLVHEAEIMPQTEGLFRDWGYELARREYGDLLVTEAELEANFGGELPRGRVLLQDRRTSEMMRELVTRPEHYDVIATPNLNGLFLSQLSLASVRGSGLFPVGFFGSKAAIFEARHETLASLDSREFNPTPTLLAGVMLFEHLGWKDAAELLTNAVFKTISDGCVTGDLAIDMDEEQVDAPAFCDAVMENFEEVRKSRVRKAIERVASGVSASI